MKIGKKRTTSGIIHKPVNLPTKNSDPIIKEFVQALLHEGDLPFRSATKSHFKAIFWKIDEELLRLFKEELQEKLLSLHANLPKDEQEKFVWETFLGNILAFIPFVNAQDKDIFLIPCKNSDNTYSIVEYEVKILQLAITRFSGPMQAVALTPKDSNYGPILSFSGTTYPAADSFATTVLADFTPFNAVGEAIDLSEVEKWIKDKSNVQLIGASLGGALCFHTLRKFQDKLSMINAYGAPGLYENCWNNIEIKIPVNIFTQTGDLVPKMGVWPTGKHVHLYRITPVEDKGSKFPIATHARAFTGCETIEIEKLDPAEENKKTSRRVLTRLHQIFGCLIYCPIKLILCIRWIFTQIKDAMTSCYASVKGRIKPQDSQLP